jgi:hypothetical protein
MVAAKPHSFEILIGGIIAAASLLATIFKSRAERVGLSSLNVTAH